MTRSALITGATGFVGQHLALRLRADDWRVTAITRPTSAPHRVARLAEADVVCVDLDGGIDALTEVVRNASPDVVFHLATLFVAAHRPADTGPLVDANVRFGALLLESMRAVGCNRLVTAGTAWQQHEDRDYAPMSLYAATKQAFDCIVAYYVELAFFRAAVLMLPDIYGPDDERRKLLWAMREAANGNQPLALSAGAQLLQPVHVEDAVAAFVIAAARLESGEPRLERWAVRPGETLTLREFVQLYETARGVTVPVQWGARPYRARERFRPWTAGETLPGWTPQVSLRDGLSAL